MIANLIYDQAMNTHDYPLAAATSMVSLAVTLLVVYALQRFFSRFIRGVER
jgi:ABC-type spermidine/putrescine transport system permease subunit I